MIRSENARAADRAAPAKAARVPGPRRIAVVGLVLLALFIVVILRAAELQLVDGEKYGAVALRQASLSANISAKRGVIEDRHGGELAITVDVDSIYAEPRKVEDHDATARQLAPLLGQPLQTVHERIARDRSFVFLKRRVDPQLAERVRALRIKGIGTVPEPKRFYTQRELAAHIVGFSSADGQGKAGIEKQYDGELRGKSYELPGLRDALGNRVLSEGFVPQAVLEGADVQLTIDRQIQHAAEEALEDTILKNRAAGGVAIVLEPRSGDVLAMASYPKFNPNNLKGTDASHHLNRAIAAVFEPGSTTKMVTIAGALEDNLIKPDDRIDCEQGRFRIGRRTIGDAHQGYGELSIGEIMKVSSNVCTAKIGIHLGSRRLHHWLSEFGFGEATGIELPGELRGLVRPFEEWREIALANIAFGQGISVTPLQIAQAAATIANGGVRVRPRIVREIVEKSGRRSVPDRPPPERVLSERTAGEVTRMMEEVTRKGGTAESAAVPGFSVAGKTGTAQKIDPVTKAYSRELYVASFVGFIPADRPEMVILVLVDEPKGSIYGGTVAAPAFREIALHALSAREIFPEDTAAREAFLASFRPAGERSDRSSGSVETFPGSSYGEPGRGEAAVAGPPAERTGTSGSMTLESLEKIGDSGEAPIDGALSSEAQALLGVPPLPSAERARPPFGRPGRPVASPAEPFRMPNFAGLKLHEVLNRSAEVHCDPVLVGTGRVIAQTPAAGEILVPGSRCELKLSPSG